MVSIRSGRKLRSRRVWSAGGLGKEGLQAIELQDLGVSQRIRFRRTSAGD